MKRTELELTRMSSAKLLAILHKYNPFGGYSIGYRKGQLTRNQAIATILRYEQTARSERERVIAELIAKYGNFPDLIRDVCGTAWNAAIDAAAKLCHDLAFDGDMIFTAALACEKAILALKGDHNVEQSGT